MNFEDIASIFPKAERVDLLKRHLELVLEANQVTNLTAIRDFGEGVIKHVYDCLLPLKYVDISNSRVLDIGSGAGFPGLVFAIAVPSAQVSLVESNGKKARFLNHAIGELRLNNAKVILKRAEDLLDRESYDFVTARAVGSLNSLLEIAAPLLRVGGCFISMRGHGGDDDLAKACHAIKVLGLKEGETHKEELPENAGTRFISLAYKERKTPARYPRPYSEISSKPL